MEVVVRIDDSTSENINQVFGPPGDFPFIANREYVVFFSERRFTVRSCAKRREML